MPQTITNHNATGHIHIDRMTVNGPIRHKPLGTLFYTYEESLGAVVPAGASAYTPKRRKYPRPDDMYIKSSVVGDDEIADRLLFDCCPPQILQGHNFFGHADLSDYVYVIFRRQLQKHGLTATKEEINRWQTGRLVNLSEIHLTGNFWVPPHLKAMLLEAIDNANRTGKQRSILSCITLGQGPTRRSTHVETCIYDKYPVLKKQWQKPGEFQAELIELADGSIRIEIRLYEGGLAYRGLKSVEAWANIDVDALFFELLAGFNVGNAIQPLLTADELVLLTKAEQITYLLWILKQDLNALLSPSTVSRHSRSIMSKVGIDIRSGNRPMRLPPVELMELLQPSSIVPVPDWAEASGRYWAAATPWDAR